MTELPIACTLGPAEGADRIREWGDLLTAHAVGRHTEPGRVLVRFADVPPVATTLPRLVEAERDCCGFLNWTVSRVADTWQLEITGEPDAVATLPFGG